MYHKTQQTDCSLENAIRSRDICNSHYTIATNNDIDDSSKTPLQWWKIIFAYLTIVPTLILLPFSPAHRFLSCILFKYSRFYFCQIEREYLDTRCQRINLFMGISHKQGSAVWVKENRLLGSGPGVNIDRSFGSEDIRVMGLKFKHALVRVRYSNELFIC